MDSDSKDPIGRRWWSAQRVWGRVRLTFAGEKLELNESRLENRQAGYHSAIGQVRRPFDMVVSVCLFLHP